MSANLEEDAEVNKSLQAHHCGVSLIVESILLAPLSLS